MKLSRTQYAQYEVVIFPNTGAIVVCDLNVKSIKRGKVYAFSVDREIMRYFSMEQWVSAIKIDDERASDAIKRYLDWVKTKGLNDLEYQKNLKEIRNKKQNAAGIFSEYQLRSLWHITHRENIPNILRFGLLSHYDAHVRKLNCRDISDCEAQKLRLRKEPFYNRSIQDYVPLYLNPKNPMLYVRKHIQHNLCIIEVSLSIFLECDYLITDGNASSLSTKFFDSLESLDKIPWDVINSENWSNYEDGKRKRCAEVLIYPKVELYHIIKVHCCTKNTLEFLLHHKCNAEISTNLYF